MQKAALDTARRPTQSRGTKIALLRTLASLTFLTAVFPAAGAADTNPPPRLTVELRDGSRVVGDCVEKSLRFYSALLGEIKIEAKDVRSVECISTNMAKLATASGDQLTVTLVRTTTPCALGTIAILISIVFSRESST